jgi:hypothetical protein
MITGGSASNVFFLFTGVAFTFFGVSGAIVAGVAAGVSTILMPPPKSPSGMPGVADPFGLDGVFFFPAFAVGFGLRIWPSGPSLVCAGVGMSSGRVTSGGDGGVEGGGGTDRGNAPGILEVGIGGIEGAIDTDKDAMRC